MPTTPDHPADQLRAVVDVLADAESYLSALHGAVGRHDHIGADLTCGGCNLTSRLAPALAVARQLLGTSTGEDTAVDDTVHACPDRWGGPNCRCFDDDQPNHPGAELFAALQHAGYDIDEANQRMDAYTDLVRRQEKPILESLARDTDRLRKDWIEMRDRAERLEAEAKRLAAAAPPAPADRAAGDVRHRIARALDREDSVNWGYDHGFENRYGVDEETDAFVDAVLAALAGEAAAGAHHPTEADTLAPWLYQRFMNGGAGWDRLDEDDRSYWEHHARAVRRAVARGGFNGMDPSRLLGIDDETPAVPAAPEETR